VELLLEQRAEQLLLRPAVSLSTDRLRCSRFQLPWLIYLLNLVEFEGCIVLRPGREYIGFVELMGDSFVRDGIDADEDRWVQSNHHSMTTLFPDRKDTSPGARLPPVSLRLPGSNYHTSRIETV